MLLIDTLLIGQALLGAFDNLWHHEWQARLPRQRGARRELALHAAREALYGALFLAIAWWPRDTRTLPIFNRTILRWGFVLLGTALVVGLLAAWWLSRQLGSLRRYADAVTAGNRVFIKMSEYTPRFSALRTSLARDSPATYSITR
mgnify:CR=1 FL=1